MRAQICAQAFYAWVRKAEAGFQWCVVSLPLWDLDVEFRSLGLCYKCFYLEPSCWPGKVFHFVFSIFLLGKKKSQLLVLPFCHFLTPLYPGTLSKLAIPQSQFDGLNLKKPCGTFQKSVFAHYFSRRA